MKQSSQLNGLIPRPVSVVAAEGSLPVRSLKTISVDSDLQCFGTELSAMFRYFGVDLPVTTDRSGTVRIELDPSLQAESLNLKITPESIRLSGGDPAGILYAIAAMRQLLPLVFSGGAEKAAFECGEINDSPLLGWRGFMLDSARHFQSKETIKEVIRLNVLHWHLTDGQGWRIRSELVPALSALGQISFGQYTKADLREIAAYAAEHCIKIVPEVDMPGHSYGLLQHYPQYACDSAHPGSEFCLGSPEVKTFLKKILAEVVEIFPASPIIHIGGDEASTRCWKKCPRCQAAMQAAGLTDERELENRFMVEMTRYVVELGRTPMVWFTKSVLPPDTIIQAWTSVLDLDQTVPHGNKVVNSVHYNFYFDYPENSSEAHAPWMPLLPEENVYVANPYVHLRRALKDKLLGVEACLWTENVPQWRVIPKMLPRLWAFAETAWSHPDNKVWGDFKRRRMQLEAAGYRAFLDRKYR